MRHSTYAIVVILVYWTMGASQTANQPTGDGSSGSPYQIATLDNLYWITQNSGSWDKYFIQTSDIDASDTQGWANGLPKIGWTSPTFNGNYDGQNYRISELYINRTDAAGLFAYVGSSGVVENINLSDCEIIGGSSTYTGSIVSYHQGTINHCYSSGSVSGSTNVGGMVGYVWGGSITNSRTECSVNATSTKVGGFVGYLLSGSITRCGAKGNVESSHSGDCYVGGFVGLNTGTISYSYATGDATGASYIGAFAGANESGGTISNCFSQGEYWGTGTELGGLAGENGGNISYCYSLACGQLTYPGHPVTKEGSSIGYNYGTATELIYYTENLSDPGCGDNQGTFTATAIRDFSLLRLQSTYTTPYPGWDFTNHWEIKSNVITRHGFAQFQWENIPPPVASAPGQTEGVYQIGSLDELRWIVENSERWSYDYRQTADIDFADAIPPLDEWIDGIYGSGWTSIGQLWSGTKFSGSFDGGSYTISGLYQNKRAATGLFGEINSAGTVVNVGLIDANITSTETQGGVLASINAGAISKCYTTGSLNAKQEAGGLIGKNTGSISDSYSRVNVTRSSGSETSLGGLAGLHSTGTMSNSYSTGWVKDEFGNVGGGFAGTVNAGTFSNCFWDTETSGTSSSSGTGSGVIGKTTSEMKTLSTFTDAGWDFSSTWELIGVNYPRLQENADQSLPVTLSSFTGKATKAGVVLEWETSAEVENQGFIISRQSSVDSRDGFQTRPAVIASFATHDALKGQGSTTETTKYSFTDTSVEPVKTYIYTLADVDYSGNETILEKVEINVDTEGTIIAESYTLRHVYPNPFNASFTVPFSLNEQMAVKVSLYNIAGQKVMSIINHELSAGDYHFLVKADALSSGVYFLKTSLGKGIHTQKIVLMK